MVKPLKLQEQVKSKAGCDKQSKISSFFEKKTSESGLFTKVLSASIPKRNQYSTVGLETKVNKFLGNVNNCNSIHDSKEIVCIDDESDSTSSHHHDKSRNTGDVNMDKTQCMIDAKMTVGRQISNFDALWPDKSPVKVYQGSKLTIKRQAKSGMSPNSKRLPKKESIILRDVTDDNCDTIGASALVADKAKRNLFLTGDKCLINTSESLTRAGRLTKERAYQFGFKEKMQNMEKKVTLEDDKILAKLLRSVTSPLLEQKSKNEASNGAVTVKSKRDVTLSTEKGHNKITFERPVFASVTSNKVLPLQSDIEILEKLFGSDSSGDEYRILDCKASRKGCENSLKLKDQLGDNVNSDLLVKVNFDDSVLKDELIVIEDSETISKAHSPVSYSNEPIVIEDSEAVYQQAMDFVEILDFDADSSTKNSIVKENVGSKASKEAVSPLPYIQCNALDKVPVTNESINKKSCFVKGSCSDLTNHGDKLLNLHDSEHNTTQGLNENNVKRTDSILKTLSCNAAAVPVSASDDLSASLCDIFSDSFDEELFQEKTADVSDQVHKDFRFTDLWQRFCVDEVFHKRETDEIHLSLKKEMSQKLYLCVLTGFWADTKVEKDDIVNIIGEFHNDTCVLNDKSGLIIVNPDLLLSGTLVVSSIFCPRKSVLNEKFKGVDKGNIQMLHGSIIHSLFQTVMKEGLRHESAVLTVAKSLLRSNKILHDMYGHGVEENVVMEEIKLYIPSLFSWLKKHTEWLGNGKKVVKESDLIVTEIHDIEENFWSPRFGIKGKIDMTVKAKMKKPNKSDDVKILPLELKTGKASFSSEHKGQVTLYSMMYSDRRDDPEEGILLYLKHGDMQTVSVRPESKSGLMQLRNQLAYYLTRQVSQKTSTDQSLTYCMGQLPKPLNSQRACSSCPQLLNCSIYQRSVETNVFPKEHAMSQLVPEALSHLTEEDLNFFMYWTLCLEMESKQSDQKKIWCASSLDREKAGDCISNLIITNSELGIPESQCFNEGKGCSLTFKRHVSHPGPPLNTVGLSSGSMVVVSSEDGRYIALTTGFIRIISASDVEVVVDRDYLHDTSILSRLKFRLDRNDSFSTLGYMLTNLSKLMESTQQAKHLRDVIIKKIPPQFELKISKALILKMKPVFKPLNKPQKLAILKVLMAKDYVLIRGFPGTGKTSTIVALVQILLLTGQSVLLTSYTHSAVDTILLKLKEAGVRFLRLGRRGRIHPSILPYSSEILTSSPDINSVQKLKQFYDSYDVIATSCLGMNNPLFNMRKFDVCIVDEASQVLQPACLGPLFNCSKFVLVGDPKQLPPIVKSNEARNLGMDESLFARLEGCGATYDLNLQYRMNRVIMELSNRLVYQGKLECGSAAVAEQCLELDMESLQACPAWMKEVLSPVLQNAVVFLDTGMTNTKESKDGKGFFNNFEAELVVSILQTLVKANLKSESLGVISPYNSQIKLIQLKVKGCHDVDDIEVNTVDQYQGRDKCVIIVSFVRTEKDHVGELLKDLRRLNVALTRAKHKLILIGNAAALKSYEHVAKLLIWLEENNNIITVPLQE